MIFFVSKIEPLSFEQNMSVYECHCSISFSYLAHRNLLNYTFISTLLSCKLFITGSLHFCSCTLTKTNLIMSYITGNKGLYFPQCEGAVYLLIKLFWCLLCQVSPEGRVSPVPHSGSWGQRVPGERWGKFNVCYIAKNSELLIYGLSEPVIRPGSLSDNYHIQ